MELGQSITLAMEQEPGPEPEPEPQPHACLKCGTLPAASAARCAHDGGWHGAFSDCSAKCAWGLGSGRLGLAHWSCCCETDNSALCANPPAHSFAAAPPVPEDDSLFARDCPRYVVDLDAPPEQRWRHVVADIGTRAIPSTPGCTGTHLICLRFQYADRLLGVIGLADEILGDLGGKIIEPLLATAVSVGFVSYGDELRGVSEATGIPLGRVVMLQIAYEAYVHKQSPPHPDSKRHL